MSRGRGNRPAYLPALGVLAAGFTVGAVMFILGGPVVGFTLGGSVWAGGTGWLQSRHNRQLGPDEPEAGAGSGGRLEIKHRQLAPGVNRVTCSHCGPVADLATQRLAARHVTRHRHDHQAGHPSDSIQPQEQDHPQ